MSSNNTNEKLHCENCGRIWNLCYFMQNSVLRFREESRMLVSSCSLFAGFCSSSKGTLFSIDFYVPLLSSSLDKTTKANSMKQNLVILFIVK